MLDRLVSQADVFITNVPLPARDRLRIRYADFADTCPRLIYASLTAYGEEGEEAGKTGFDATAYWARSGLMDEVRPDHRAIPARSVAGMGDHPTAMALYGGIVTALYQREKTGRGGEVRASLMAGGMWANSYLIQAKLCGVTFPPRPPREDSVSALGNIYRTADDRWFMLAVLNERQWPALARAVGMPELADDPRFARPEARARQRKAADQPARRSLRPETAGGMACDPRRRGPDLRCRRHGGGDRDRSSGFGDRHAASARGNRNDDGGQPVHPQRSGKSPGRTGPRPRRA